jgi:hypothetical protein
METDRRIPTDGLVLRGYYNAITLVRNNNPKLNFEQSFNQ